MWRPRPRVRHQALPGPPWHRPPLLHRSAIVQRRSSRRTCRVPPWGPDQPPASCPLLHEMRSRARASAQDGCPSCRSPAPRRSTGAQRLALARAVSSARQAVCRSLRAQAPCAGWLGRSAGRALRPAGPPAPPGRRRPPHPPPHCATPAWRSASASAGAAARRAQPPPARQADASLEIVQRAPPRPCRGRLRSRCVAGARARRGQLRRISRAVARRAVARGAGRAARPPRIARVRELRQVRDHLGGLSLQRAQRRQRARVSARQGLPPRVRQACF